MPDRERERGDMSGTFMLHALPAGTLPVASSFAFFGSSDSALVDLGFYVWLVTDGSTIGLVDTGLPLEATELDALRASDPFHSVRLLPELLNEAGLSGADVDFVAITQTVTYHTGGIDAGLLPNARFYLALAGVAEMLGEPPGHPGTALYFTQRGWDSMRRLAIEDRLRCVDGPVEIVPGVVFETTGGHHPGSAAVRVQTSAGTTGLLETAFLQANLDRLHPIGICEDVARCRATIRRYLRECDEVVAIHEPANAGRFPLDGFVAPTARQGK